MLTKTALAVAAATALFAVTSSPAAHADAPNTAPAKNNVSNKNVTIQAGDTLSSIAQANNSTYVRLFDANSQINDPDMIFPGQTIRIPAPDEQLPDRPLPDHAKAIATTPVPAAKPAAAVAPVSATGVWDEIAACESGGNWATDTGNGFYGGLQFTLSSWESVGGSGLPSDASRDEQIARAQTLQSRQGWRAWPVCAARLGLY